MTLANLNSHCFSGHFSQFRRRKLAFSGGSHFVSEGSLPSLHSSSSATNMGDLHERESFLNETLQLNPNSSLSNASFASLLCGSVAHYSGLVVTPSAGTYFLLPNCFFHNASTLSSISLTRMIIIAENSTSLDGGPFGRFRASPLLASLSFSDCLFLNDDNSTYVITAAGWQSLFSNATHHLSTLSIRNSQLFGVLPSSLPAIMNSFDVSNNNLGGTIASNLFSNFDASSNSLILRLSNNNLNGTIPSDLWSTGGNFSSIKSLALYLNSNALAGSIPSSLLHIMHNISETSITLDLSRNLLNGAIPETLTHDLGNVRSLRLDFSHNAFNSVFPSSLLVSTKLSNATTIMLDMSACGLNGTLPQDIFGNWSRLASLSFDVSHNQLTGLIPPSLLAPSSSHSIASTSIDLSFNQFSGSLPLSAFEVLNVSKTSTLYFAANDNKLSGDLPSIMFSEYSSPRNIDLSFNLQNNPLDGSIPASFLESINPSSALECPSSDECSSSSELWFTISLDISGTNLTDSLVIPDLSSRRDLQPLGLWIDASAGHFHQMIIHPNSYRYLTSLNVGGNSEMSGTLPMSLFLPNSTLSSLTANSSGLQGVLPDLGQLQPTKLTKLDLDSTNGIDFCAEPRSSWSSSDVSCRLSNTNSYLCSKLYPSTCRITAPPTLAPVDVPQNVPVPVQSVTPSICSASTQPAPDFVCIDGTWTTYNHISEKVFSVPAGAFETDINANLSSYRVIFGSIGSSLNIRDSVDGLFHIKIMMTQSDLSTIWNTITQKVVTYGSNSTDLSYVQITAHLDKSSCKNLLVSTVHGDGMISARIKVDDSRCQVWWKALICVIIGLLLIAGVIVGLMYGCKKELESSSETAN